jgi:antitoxin ParD1/3/4
MITITLPESLKSVLDAEVAAGGYADPTSYIHELVLKESRQRQARDRVEALLEEGLNSGEAAEWTAQDWEEIRRQVQQRLTAANGNAP